jgi:hypothetical protein
VNARSFRAEKACARALATSLALASCAFVASVSTRAEARDETTFAYGAPRYVPQERAASAGLVIAPKSVAQGTKVPLVVFLHGLNQDGPLHKWLGARGTQDIAVLLEKLQTEGKTAPFLIAGPSQTKDAARPWGMWQNFDLGDFVAKTEAALGTRATVDRSRVIVLAHSGGGCNVHGSALRAASSRGVVPFAVVLADTCFDRGVAETLLLAAPETRIFAYYQTQSWERDFGPFRAAFFGARPGQGPREKRFVEVPLRGAGAHDRLFSVAVERAFPELLGRAASAGASGAPGSTRSSGSARE